MSGIPLTGRPAVAALAIAAVVVLSGCVGTTGLADDVAPGQEENSTTTTAAGTTGSQSTATPTSSGEEASSGSTDTGDVATPTESTTATDATSQIDACEAYEVREGPRANAELESDDEICITEWDNKAYQDSYTVTGVIGNPSDETIDHVSVEVTLYKDGNALATRTAGIDDLGESDRFVVEFVEPFEGEDAPEPVGDVSYRIHATVGGSTAPPTTTAGPRTETGSSTGSESADGAGSTTETEPSSDGAEATEDCEPTYAVDPVETQNVETVGVRDGEWTVVYGEVYNFWAYDVIEGGDIVLDVTLQGESGDEITTEKAIVEDMRGVNVTPFAVAVDVEADRVDRAYATWTVDRQKWIEALCSEEEIGDGQTG